jgi:hypothetical protein
VLLERIEEDREMVLSQEGLWGVRAVLRESAAN